MTKNIVAMTQLELVAELDRMRAALDFFESEIERRAEQLAAGAPKGMHVPYTGDFVSAPPSVIGRLRWHLRNIRGWK